MLVPIPTLGSISRFPCVPMARGQWEEQKPWTWPAGSRQELPKPRGTGAHRQFIPCPTQCCEGPCPSGAGAEPGSLLWKQHPWEAGPALEEFSLRDFSGLDGMWGCPSPVLTVSRNNLDMLCPYSGACGCPDTAGTATVTPGQLSSAVTDPSVRLQPLHISTHQCSQDGLIHAPSALPTSSQMGLGSGAGFKLPRGNAAMPGRAFEEIWDPSHRWNAEPGPQCDVWSPCVR